MSPLGVGGALRRGPCPASGEHRLGDLAALRLGTLAGVVKEQLLQGLEQRVEASQLLRSGPATIAGHGYHVCVTPRAVG